jgi:hypothetical protein
MFRRGGGRAGITEEDDPEDDKLVGAATAAAVEDSFSLTCTLPLLDVVELPELLAIKPHKSPIEASLESLVVDSLGI